MGRGGVSFDSLVCFLYTSAFCRGKGGWGWGFKMTPNGIQFFPRLPNPQLEIARSFLSFGSGAKLPIEGGPRTFGRVTLPSIVARVARQPPTAVQALLEKEFQAAGGRFASGSH